MRLVLGQQGEGRAAGPRRWPAAASVSPAYGSSRVCMPRTSRPRRRPSADGGDGAYAGSAAGTSALRLEQERDLGVEQPPGRGELGDGPLAGRARVLQLADRQLVAVDHGVQLGDQLLARRRRR